MNDQHNHHCMLTFAGFDWWIIRCSANCISVMRQGPKPCVGVATLIMADIDTRQVDWDAYCSAAVTWDERR